MKRGLKIQAGNGSYLYPSGSLPSDAIPPVPDLTNTIMLYALWGVAAGWQNGSALIADGDGPISSTAALPYPLNWAAVTTPTQLTFYDQSGNTNDADGGGHEPDINVGSQIITYNGTDQYVVPAGSPISGDDKISIYCVFKTDSLATLQTLFQYFYTQNYLTTEANIFIAHITSSAIITVSQKLDDVVDVFNTKIKTLGDTDYHLLTVIFDRTAVAANQTIAKLDNSTSGWTAAVSGDMASSVFDDARPLGIGIGQPLGTDAFLDGQLPYLQINRGADDDAYQTSVYNYVKGLIPSIP